MTIDKQNEEKPSLAKLLQLAVDSKLADMHTTLPGIVKSYDRAKQTIKVQPALRRRYTDGRTVDLPIINNVPVVFPRSKGRWLHFDLEADDVVTLVFSERSLDAWKAKGGLISPDDPRKFNLSDAYALPGGYPTTEPLAQNGGEGSIEVANGTDHIVIEKDGKIFADNGTISLTMTPDGQFTVETTSGKLDMTPDGKFQLTNNTEELVDLLVQLTQILSTTTTNTIFGPLQLNDFAAIAQIKTKLETLKGG